MSVNIGQALQEGGSRTIARNGLYFVAVFWVLNVLNGLFSNTDSRGAMQDLPGQPSMGVQPVDPTLGLSPAVAGVLSVVLSLLSLVVGAAAIRTFVSRETETIQGEFFTRNLLWMLVNLVVGGIVFAVVVFVGLIFLFFPGIFLLVSLFFWNVLVVVEDRNFVDAFQSSWALTRGNRFMLFLLGFVVVIIALVIGGVFAVASVFLPGIVELAISQIGAAFASVFGVATTARAYVQLATGESGDGSPTVA